MLRVYHETIGPKGGNFDEIHTYEVDLMYNSLLKQGTGGKLDVMDYFYHEMWSCVMEMKLPAFVPFIMKLIEDSWLALRCTPLMHFVPLNLSTHEVKKLRIKTHSVPVEVAPSVHDQDSKLACRLQQVFCLNAAINKRQYE
jgi:hypothetical protein